ncbi:hypothetical protein EDB89DRAFT_2081002 [Lactarius sanguifluus]|nr:hypothetical protein EDB89DRAFT_2081002 [Lactarius sanguifluus]
MRPELDNVLQSLILNGYSAFSLIDDILAHGRNREDQRIVLLRGGVERDAADICARLLEYDPTSASVSAWALGVVHLTLRSTVEEKTREDSEHDPHSMTDHRLSLRNNCGRVQSKNYRGGVTIDVLPDNVFLDISDFCLREPTTDRIKIIQRTKEWQRLVHVCQRWRRIVFASPHRLDLHLGCSYGTPIRQNLGFWPLTLPLTLDYSGRLDFNYGMGLAPEDECNLIAALGHAASRIHRIDILASSPLLNILATVMQIPFPALTHLDLTWDHKDLPAPFSRGVPVIPSGRFLGGSAPRLQYFRLERTSNSRRPQGAVIHESFLMLESSVHVGPTSYS